MPRKFISSLAAAAVALTSFSAVPAAADNRNLERFVIGAGTILLLSEINRNTSKVQKNYNYQDTSHRGRKGKKGWGNRRLAPIPGYCLTSVRKGRHTIRMFGSRCLWNNYRDARRLPGHCKIHVTDRRHGRKIHRVGYSPKCLRRSGFQVAGGRHY